MLTSFIVVALVAIGAVLANDNGKFILAMHNPCIVQ